MRRNKGITLVALVVTIIVLLILAGISIALLTGQNGIITRATDARNESLKGIEKEQITLAYGTEKSFLLEQGSTESVKAEDLENRLRTDGANVTNVEEENENLIVTFDTGNVYFVDSNGNITEGISPVPPAPPALGEVDEPTGITKIEFTKPHGVVEIVWLDLNNNVIAKPYSPNLGSMEKVAWDTSNNEVTPSTNIGWYDYNSNKWANAKNPEDGSYFVWIPRYAYKIIYFDTEPNKNAYIADNTSRTGMTGYSTIHGIVNLNGEVNQGSQTNITDTVQTVGYRDYIPHPAFLGTGYENIGGGFGDSTKGIRGIWVAKYEMAKEDSVDSGVTWTAGTTGNVATTKAGSSHYIRAVSKPGVSSWRDVNIANCYENAYHYDRNKESHLIKNSEWGAVAYLTHSKYGRNGAEITINNNGTTFYTGGGAGTAYKTKTNQSTTGNTYGIYDLSGNTAEYTTGFNKEYNSTYFESSHYSEKGNMFATYNGTSTKYATAYSNNNSTSNADFTVGDVSHTGDAIREVWVSANRGWFSDYASFVNISGPFFGRGGHCYVGTGAGVFTSSYYNGNGGNDYGFRVVLAK